jgi:HPt (histidine-containing phosphotransfer) domain-containing protein
VQNGFMSDLDDTLAALRADYAAELPRLIRDLGALVEAAAIDAAVLQRARDAAHRLRGTAGSYGFVAVGEAAGHVEDALEQGAGGVPELVRALAALAPQPAPKSSGRSK